MTQESGRGTGDLFLCILSPVFCLPLSPTMIPFMSEPTLRQIVEALLFSAPEPIAIEKLQSIAGAEDAKAVKTALEEILADCEAQNRPYFVQELAGGVRLSSKPESAPWIARLTEERQGKLSPAALETLAIIAYKQPISRAEIEAIRGVQAGPILQTLSDRDLIRVTGKSDALGHPLLYGTSTTFLEVFGLKALADLPNINEGLPTPAGTGTAIVTAPADPVPAAPDNPVS